MRASKPRGATLLPHAATRALRLIASCLLCVLISIAAWGQEPGSSNPIQNPSNLTVFPVDDIATLRSDRTIASSALIDYVATNAALTAWSQTGQTMESSDPCTQSLGRRLLSGRVSTPKFEQPICMTPSGLSLYYGQKPTAQGQYLRYQFPVIGVGTEHRSFDAQTGMFDRAGGTDQLLHMDAATAHRDLSGTLSVSVIGYNPATTTTDQALALRDSWVDDSGRKVTGDVAVAVGDFNGDGALDILVWADTSTGTLSSSTGRIDMVSFSYDATTRSLTHVGTLSIETAGKPASIVAAAGDFATIGTDQAMMAYYLARDSNPIHVSYFQLNAKLEPAPAKVEKDMSGKAAKGSYFEIKPGLFAFDPSLTSPATGAPGFHTRQLAMTWVEASGTTRVSIVSVAEGGTTLNESGQTTLGDSRYTTRFDSIGPSLGVGNFIGLQDDGVDPTDQIAVAIPTADASSPGSTITELVTAVVSHDSGTGRFSIRQTETIRDHIYSVQGIVYGPGLAALDSLGRAFFLGNPAHIQVPSLIDPQYVVYMPPHHVDCLPTESNPTECEIVNISAFGSFNVKLEDSQSSTIKQESTDTSSSDFGIGASISVSETVSASAMEIATMSASAQVTDSFSYETNTVEKNINSSYQTITTQKSATTNIDDQLGFNQRMIDIWRYPVFGLDLGQLEQYPYYEITIPGPLVPYQSDGLTVSWFNPSHINNNALSYPTIGSPDFPSDLGTFTYDDQGTPVSVTSPLNDGTVRSFAGNSQTYSLTYTEGSGGSSERSYSYNLSNTVDIKTGFSAKVKIMLVDSETKVDTSLNLTNKASWGTSTVASRSMSESKGITLNQPSVTGIQTKAYQYQTLVYITGNGGIKVAHAVDFETATGKEWWYTTYKKADPALNLPLRLVQTSDGSDWVLNTDDSSHWMRGISLTSDELNELTDTYPYLSGAVDQGEKVRVLVDVHNLSLASTSSDVQVQLAYQALDPATFEPVGPEVVFDTSATMKLAPRALQQVVGIWDTGQLSMTESTPYRFVVRLLTDESNDLHGMSASAGGNDYGVWPYNNTGVFVFPKISSAQTAEAPDGHAKVAVDLVARNAPGPYLSHDAVITLTTDTDHRGAVHLVVSQPTGDPDGRELVLGSTMIWGLPAGTRTLRLGIPRTLSGGISTESVMAKHASGEAHVVARLFSHHQ